MATETDIHGYIYSKTTLRAKIDATEELITALEAKLLEGIGTSNVQEYQVNTGQTIVRTMYTNINEIERAIAWLEARSIKFRNQLNGRRNSLRDRDTIH